MKYYKGQLIIDNIDFDHIMGWGDSEVPSEAFKEGLKEELSLNGLEEKEVNVIMLYLK